MFDCLIESRRPHAPRRVVSVGALSITTHAAIIASAVLATLHVSQRGNALLADTTMVYLGHDRQPEQKAPARPVQPVAFDQPLKGFQAVVAPTDIPSHIPPVRLGEAFNPADYSGVGVEGGVANGVLPAAGDVYLEAIVEEKPSLLSSPPSFYPELLRTAGIQGRVILQAIVDTLGRAEPGSIKIITSPDSGFNVVSRTWLLHALFRPAHVHGRAVRVLVAVPLDYHITGPTAAR
ncbi:MAG TPA: energy transducer TonB [Gemmatimonadales bacterium]|nr:energy transducer TonB [Gemmatimonadales bacterium]